jgi:hypothetical protein
MDQKLWMFEVSRRSLGRACVVANEEELTTLQNFWGQGGWAVVDHAPTKGRRLLGRQWLPVRRSLVGRRDNDWWSAASRGIEPVCTGCEYIFYLLKKEKVTYLFIYFSGPCM